MIGKSAVYSSSAIIAEAQVGEVEVERGEEFVEFWCICGEREFYLSGALPFGVGDQSATCEHCGRTYRYVALITVAGGPEGRRRPRSAYFSHFVLEWDPESGMTTTTFADGTRCACPVVPDDSIHAAELGITPQQHRLLHELMHHLVGIHVYGRGFSPIIWREAHGVSHDIESHASAIGTGGAGWQEEEWLVTALSHRLFGRLERDHGAWQWLASNYESDDLRSPMRGELVLRDARAELAECFGWDVPKGAE